MWEWGEVAAAAFTLLAKAESSAICIPFPYSFLCLCCSTGLVFETVLETEPRISCILPLNCTTPPALFKVYISFKIYFYLMRVNAWMYVCMPCACLVPEEARSELDPLELDFEL